MRVSLWLGSGESPFPGFSHGRKQKRGSNLSHVSHNKSAKPIMKAPPLGSNPFPKTPAPNAILLGVRGSMHEFEGVQTFRP